MTRAEPTGLPFGRRQESPAGGVRRARVRIGSLFQAESSNFFMLLGVTLFMVAFGLLMVLSSSYVDARSIGQDFFSRFGTQALYAAVGLPVMFLLSRVPARFWMRVSWLALIASCALQALVVFTPLGHGVNQNRNWLALGPVTFQPSEAIKLSLILWLATFLTRREGRIDRWHQALPPVLLASGVSLGLVLAGNDLGTVMVMAALVFGALFFAGVPIRHLIALGVIGAGAIMMFAISSKSRMDRIMSFLQPASGTDYNDGYQVQQGMWGMANGGVFGVGLGNSESKWRWLPASSTDFIFAITAEELGLIGGVLVIGLFAFLAVSLVRIIRASDSAFGRVATGGVLVWLMVQALVNIAVVLGLFPVLGVPLPLISAGGTALISTLAALGIVLSFARVRPVTDAPVAAPRRAPVSR